MRVLQKRKQSPVTAESSVSANLMVASSTDSEFKFKEGLHPFNHSYKKYIIE